MSSRWMRPTQRNEKELSERTNVIKLKFLPNTKKHPPRLI